MKILYAIQGTGNGHISRARDIAPLLSKYADLDLLISGVQADLPLGFPVKYQFRGLSLIFGKNGGVDVPATFRESNLRRLLGEINSLPVEAYDLVISDFEPVSAWACYNRGKTCIGLSHQAAVLNKNAPRPKKFDPVGKLVLKSYAPVTTGYGFHFQAYGDRIFTPVIRQIVKILPRYKKTRWEVFSKKAEKSFSEGNVFIQPIDNEAFLKSMASATGVFCGGGFETPSEALFLGKKLMVVPMKGQYEQQCNAAALKKIGVPVIKSLKKRHLPKIEAWLADGAVPEVNYSDETEQIVKMIIEKHAEKQVESTTEDRISGLKELKRLTLMKVLGKIAESQLKTS